MKYIEGLPNNYIGGLSNEIHRRLSNELYRGVVQQFILEACPTDLFEGLSNGIISEIDQCVFENKKKYFVLKTVFFIHGKYMCEGVGEDSRHGA